MRHKWTPEQDDELLRLIAGGMTYRQAGEAMGLGFNRARRRAYFLKVGSTDIYRKGLKCGSCGGPLSDLAKRDLCRSCNTRAMNADPEFQRHRLERLAIKQADPAHKAKMGRIGTAIIRKLMQQPSHVEMLREQGARIAREVLRRPDVIAKTYAPEVIARRAKTYSERKMAWCPEGYREEYRFLMDTKQLRSAEAKAIILSQVVADEARELARLSPFERQERALARGGKLVANDRVPSFGEAVDHGERRWEVGRVA